MHDRAVGIDVCDALGADLLRLRVHLVCLVGGHDVALPEGHGVTAFSKSRYYILADTAGKVNLPECYGLPGGG